MSRKENIRKFGGAIVAHVVDNDIGDRFNHLTSALPPLTLLT